MKIPEAIITDLENEAAGLTHGIVTLQLHLRDSHLSHYKINREKSVVALKNGVDPFGGSGTSLDVTVAIPPFGARRGKRG